MRGGCLPTKSGVPNACLEYMRDSKIHRKAGSFRKLVKIGEMLVELLMLIGCLKIGDE